MNKETKQSLTHLSKGKKKISTPKSTPFKRKEEKNKHTQKHTVQRKETIMVTNLKIANDRNND